MAKFKRISPPSRRPKLSISTNGVLFDLRLNLLPDGLAFLKRVVSLNHFEIYLITRVSEPVTHSGRIAIRLSQGSRSTK